MNSDDYFVELNKKLDGLFGDFVGGFDKLSKFGLAKDFLSFSIANTPNAHIAFQQLQEDAAEDGEVFGIYSEEMRQAALKELFEMRRDASKARDELAGILSTLTLLSQQIKNQELSVFDE